MSVIISMVIAVRLAGSWPEATSAIQTQPAPLTIAAGEVTQTRAVLWAHSSNAGEVRFSIATRADATAPLQVLTTTAVDPALPVKVEISDLQPATEYVYRVVDATGDDRAGRFRTAAPDGDQMGLRFGVSGDWRGDLAPYPAIANAPDADLDFFVALGDTIYADIPSPAVDEQPQAETLAEFRAKYAEGYGVHAGSNLWGDLRGQTAFIAMIDDHEVTNDFAGGAPPATDRRFPDNDVAFINETELYRNGLQAFHDYHPMHFRTWSGTGDPRFDGKPDLYRYFTYGADAALFVIDARSFRDTPLPGVLDLDDLPAILGFFRDTFREDRTMLGEAQLVRLKRDLLDAQQRGITWKFVLVPEPVQNFGVAGASDRYEGYAAERTELLRFIDHKGITNVVFVAADIHGTLVNEVTYPAAPVLFAEQRSIGAFEITTGPVAMYKPFGPAVIDLGVRTGLVSQADADAYASGSPAEREAILQATLNVQLAAQGYSSLGLEPEGGIDFTLTAGTWTATATFGWTEFAIDAISQDLTITTYGIAPYSRAEVEADPAAILARTPQIVQQFTVRPVE